MIIIIGLSARHAFRDRTESVRQLLVLHLLIYLITPLLLMNELRELG
jgi:hypothetical protein